MVSVVMSVYNGEKYLKKAIESILQQTYKNIEFIIIDDGSKDSSLSIIKSYKDKRIILIENKKNRGLIYSLNKGFDIAKGKYIARMDCDDISYKERIETQVETMEKNPQISLIGSSENIIFEGIPFLKKKNLLEIDEEKIKVKSMFYSTFAHPTVMIRKETLNKFNLKYEEKYKNAEDYGLWCNLLTKGICVNIDKPLLKYRIVKKSITREANKEMRERKEVFKRIYENYFNLNGIQLSNEELEIHFEICMIQNLKETKYSIKQKEEYIKNLKNKVMKLNFKKEIIDEIFGEVFIKTYIYENVELKKIDREIVNDLEFEKILYKEKIKKIIKKVYN